MTWTGSLDLCSIASAKRRTQSLEEQRSRNEDPIASQKFLLWQMRKSGGVMSLAISQGRCPKSRIVSIHHASTSEQHRLRSHGHLLTSFCSVFLSPFPLTMIAGLSDFQIRDLNDEINKLMREKYRWEQQIRDLGGVDYRVITMIKN